MAPGVQMAKFDLSLSLRRTAAGLDVDWECRSGFLPPELLKDLDAHFATLLTQLSQNSGGALATLDMRTDAERARVEQAHATLPAAAPAGFLHERIARLAADEPDRVAVHSRYGVMTRGGLEQAANRLAHRLAQAGVRPDARVCLCLERGPSVVVAILATWKAGGAYVPLDPGLPGARLQDMIEESAAAVVVCERRTLARLSPLDRACIVLDDPRFIADLALAETTPPLLAHPLEPSHLAYVIYTSGSTGRPKGVMIEQRQLLHFDQSLQAWFAAAGIRMSGRWALNPSYAFDASVLDFVQLAHGATLLPLEDEVRRDPAALLAYLQDQQVDVMGATPSQVDALLAAARPGQRLPSLVLGGEAVTGSLWARLVEHYGDSGRFAINVYGPTENTVGASISLVQPDPLAPHIGRPMPGVRCEVRDLHGAPSPLGAPGELVLGGGSVGRGYLGREDLTAERFTEVALTGSGPSRGYCTGDLVRWLPTGELDYIGRIDGQVKIRGYRVELGEIEASLKALPGVSAAAVALQDEFQGGALPVAYVVAAPGFDVPPNWDAGLRASLRLMLPEYMVPIQVRVLNELPMTGNGKLDRARLPALAVSVASGERVPPATATERELAAIWAGLFLLPEVSADDNFFDLGGHSLLLVRMASLVREVFGVDPALRDLFDAADLRATAALIDATLPVADDVAPQEDTEELEW